MDRRLVCSLWFSVALAQAPPQEPLDVALQACWEARGRARFDEAAAKLEEARNLLARTPPEAPQFGSWVQSVTQLYSSVAMTAPGARRCRAGSRACPSARPIAPAARPASEQPGGSLAGGSKPPQVSSLLGKGRSGTGSCPSLKGAAARWPCPVRSFPARCRWNC